MAGADSAVRDPVCDVAGCVKPVKARGVCTAHYQSLPREALRPPQDRTVDPLVRLLAKVSVSDDGCWDWTASERSCGYGTFWLDGHTELAHRASYRMHVGPIPEGLELDHSCRNRLCVNPAHLEPVTPAENMRRQMVSNGTGSARTHCREGHEFTAENTYWVRGKNNARRCRACLRVQDRRRRQRAG